MSTLLLITADPNQPIAWHAYRYAKAFLQMNAQDAAAHTRTLNIFFYADAAHTANKLRWQTADRADLTQAWAALSQQYGQRLPVCVSTALTRGITDSTNAARHQLDSENMAPGFELVGLGELAEQLAGANKVIQF